MSTDTKMLIFIVAVFGAIELYNLWRNSRGR